MFLIERVLHLNFESLPLLGLIHFLLIAFFEMAKTVIHNNWDTRCFMNILQGFTRATLLKMRFHLGNIFRASVWAFGVEKGSASI